MHLKFRNRKFSSVMGLNYHIRHRWVSSITVFYLGPTKMVVIGHGDSPTKIIFHITDLWFVMEPLADRWRFPPDTDEVFHASDICASIFTFLEFVQFPILNCTLWYKFVLSELYIVFITFRVVIFEKFSVLCFFFLLSYWFVLFLWNLPPFDS